jgi:hypothetical protein
VSELSELRSKLLLLIISLKRGHSKLWHFLLLSILDLLAILFHLFVSDVEHRHLVSQLLGQIIKAAHVERVQVVDVLLAGILESAVVGASILIVLLEGLGAENADLLVL